MQAIKIVVDNWSLLDSRKEQDSPPNPKPAGQIHTDDIDDPFA
jgi:hypothetical protein